MFYESATPFPPSNKKTKKKRTGVNQPLSKQEKRLSFSYNLSRLPKWPLFPVFDICLSASVDNKTIFTHVQ